MHIAQYIGQLALEVQATARDNQDWQVHAAAYRVRTAYLLGKKAFVADIATVREFGDLNA